MLLRDSAERAPRSYSSRLLWSVVLLFVFLVLGDPATCMSVTPGLQLEARSTNTSSKKECLPVQWNPYHHSSWTPGPVDQTQEITMWQQFCISNSTANFTTKFSPQKWSRSPNNLSCSEGRYHYSKTLHPYVTEDRRLCVNASITMYNLTGEIDSGDYKIIVSTTCSSSERTFQLRIDLCGIKDVPRPIQPTLEPLFIPEVRGQSTQTWKYQFYGDNQLTDYVILVMKSGEIVCDEFSPGSHNHFNCTRETHGQCNITITVHIQNYTHKDSGEYCAAAYPTGAPNPGNDSCLKLVVVQHPVVDHFPGKSHLDFGGASLEYSISSYSEYVKYKFVKGIHANDKEVINHSDGYKIDCRPHPLDNTTVTVTLHMTRKPDLAGQYTLCTSLEIGTYTSKPNCTITVSVIHVWWCVELAVCILGATALLVFIAVILYCCYRHSNKNKKNSGNDDGQGDCVALTVNNLSVIHEELLGACNEWYNIGLALDVPTFILDDIRDNVQFSNVGDKFRETLKVWLRRDSKPTWQAIVDALNKNTVGQRQLASVIKATYCTTPEASGQIVPTVQQPQQTGEDDGTPGSVRILNFLSGCTSKCCRTPPCAQGYTRVLEEESDQPAGNNHPVATGTEDRLLQNLAGEGGQNT